jgi:hypothetical protein
MENTFTYAYFAVLRTNGSQEIPKRERERERVRERVRDSAKNKRDSRDPKIGSFLHSLKLSSSNIKFISLVKTFISK